MRLRTYALTYPQLLNQAIERNWTDSALILLKDGFEYAQALFDGMYRAQHVPFICHTTRTASILMAEDESVDVVIAGLLHAAYFVGCFDDRKHGNESENHRAELRKKMGKSVEELVFEYGKTPWHQGECVKEHLMKLDTYSGRKKTLVLMRLVNDLEDYLDLQMAYRGSYPFEEKLRAYGKEAVEIARRLGRTQLAEELESVFEQNRKGKLPGELKTNMYEGYQLPLLKWLKKSTTEKIKLKAGRVLAGLAFKKGRILRREASNRG